MTAGDIGATIKFAPANLGQSATVTTLAGCSVTFVLSCQVTGYRAGPFTMVVDPSGMFATYLTNGSEFPAGGLYSIQFIVRLGTSEVTYWAPQTFTVAPQL